MSDRLQLLDTLLEREQRRRDEALAAYRQVQRQAQQARDQGQALHHYRSDYRQRWSAQFSQAAPIEIVRCYQAFVARLDQAIHTQQDTTQRIEAREAAALATLRHRELKLATVQRLIERRHAQAAQLAQRRDQKHTDETAQRLGWAARQAQAVALAQVQAADAAAGVP